MKKALTILLAVAMMFCFSATAFAADFTDTANVSKTAQDAINKVAALGIVEGYEDGSFKPAANITRAEFAKMADIAAGLEKSARDLEGAASSYKDVKTGVWYTGWVNLASAQGYVKGYENGTFGPNNNITYAEVCTVLMRLLGYNDNLTGPWPINYINKATQLDILDDVEGFSANVPATRANVAIMLAETLDQDMVVWDKDTDDWIDSKKTGKETLLENAFDGKTGQYTVEAINVKDQGKGKYELTLEPCTKDEPKVSTLKCDMATSVVGVEPAALVDRQVTIVLDIDEKEAKYIQADDEIIEVGKAEAGKDAENQIKLDGSTYNKAGSLTINAAKHYFDTTKKNNADGNEVGYALINDDDEIVKLGTDVEVGVELFGKYYLVTAVDTEDDAVITLNDEEDIDAEAEDIIIVKNGKRVDTKDVKAGDVLVDYTGDDTDVTDVAFFGLISNPGIEGEVKEYEGTVGNYTNVTVGDADYVLNANTAYFDGEYEAASDSNFKDLSDNKDKVVVYKGADNAVAFVIDDNDGTTSTNYGVLLDVKGTSGRNGFEVDAIKVFTKDGEAKEIDVKDKDEVKDKIFNADDSTGIADGAAIAYKLDKNGEVKDIIDINADTEANVKAFIGDDAAHVVKAPVTTATESAADADKEYSFPVSNNKYVKVDGANRSFKSGAVIINLKDDFEGELMKAEDVLGDDDVTASALDDETPVVNYLTVILNKDNRIEFMAGTNLGGGKTVDYAIVDRVRGTGDDQTITFEGDSKVYDLDDNQAAAVAGALVSYKLVGNTVKDVEAVTIESAARGVDVTDIDGALYTVNGTGYELAKDVVVIVNDGGDLTIGKTGDIRKTKDNGTYTISYVVNDDPEDDDVPELKLVVVNKTADNIFGN